MLLTLRQQLSRFSHLLQSELFPVLEAETGELSDTARRLIAILEMFPLARFIPCSQGWNGRPPRDRYTVLTGASVHDSQVAIPLATMSASRVQYCYELMDSAYDAVEILEHSRETGHVPIVDPKAVRQPKSTFLPGKPKRQLSWAESDRFRERTMVERVYSRLKDEFGGRYVRVRGASKVMAHLMFGVLALTADQLLKLGAET